jgi:hypothetical protein
MNDGDHSASGGSDGQKLSAEWRRAAQSGGIRGYVPDAEMATPCVAVCEGDRTVTVGVDPPTRDDIDSIDHHVVFGLDRVPAFADTSDDTNLDIDTVHVRGARDAEGPRPNRTQERIAARATANGADCQAHYILGVGPLAHQRVTETNRNELGTRVGLLADTRGLVGVRYTVPAPHPSGPTAMADADERAKLLVLPESDRALEEAPPSGVDPAAVTDPDVVVAPDSADGDLLEAFSLSALVVTDEHLGGAIADRAGELGVALGHPGTGSDSVFELRMGGLGTTSLPDPGEVPNLEWEQTTERGGVGLH